MLNENLVNKDHKTNNYFVPRNSMFTKTFKQDENKELVFNLLLDTDV